MYKEVDWVEDDNGKIVAIIHYYDLNKMSTKEKKVKSFCGQEYILDKERGDVYIKEMACYPGYEEWLEKLVEKHIAKPKESNKFFDTEEPITIVEIDNQFVVQAFHEKIIEPPGNRANGALYAFDQEFLDHLNLISPIPTDFSTEVIPKLLGRIQTWHTDHAYLDVGTPESLMTAQQLTRGQL